MRQSGAEIIDGDLCNETLLVHLFRMHNFTHVVHLAAQAGVRYSVDHPKVYVTANVMCTVNLLEVMRKRPLPLPVLGGCTSLPYSHAPPCAQQHTWSLPPSRFGEVLGNQPIPFGLHLIS